MDSIEHAIQSVLPQLQREKVEAVIHEFETTLGVEGPDDLQFIKEADISHLLSPIQCRRLINSFKSHPKSPQPITSSPVSSPSSSFSNEPYTSPLTSPQGHSKWVDGFQVQWDKMRPALKRAIDDGNRPEPGDRRHMVKVIVDSMREHCLNPTRKDCTTVAKAITQMYPGSFLDKTDEGEIIGCGYFTLLQQLKTRVEYVNRDNTLSRLRRPRRSDTSDDDQPPPPAKCAKIDSYGCINWQPQEYPEGETAQSLEEKRKEMIDIFTQDGPKAAERGRVKELMTNTYSKQREDINADPSPSILDISKRWPFLLSWKLLLSHFTTLTGVDLYTRLKDDMDKKGKRLLEYFGCQVMSWTKEVKALLKDALKANREGTDGLAALLVMMTHFKEAEDALFILADVTTTPADAEEQFVLPSTPRLIALGDTMWSANKWMLSIEGRVVIPLLPPIPDFTTALAVLFASFYVFNIEYQVEAVTTLEFVQRFLARINPNSIKCTAKVQTSRKTGRTVKRKTTDINPRVVSFMNAFSAFDWQNS
ncbi:sterile alpha motif domain-containing protein 3 [Nothobranchius furzeri]|uniref:sterile alpha motif domain-containing protein 3 n=1 Tax=Nothobranchius furzeri TaxID=105023 RepID=UPI00240453DC|nr:uncharacterized protein LOC129152922 [Nothobranchius furzeri]XP_054587147.1 uncharacterized protein LOC129152922 [Nothobranchius furzeri]XP_054593103.1 uncharacterized protein LOC107373026 [Nothobranchius furzeri]XP_054595096.1 uncharacterized protein LOC129162867 [Nothobranchius furzeri]XP_054595362.1 uncharacterized protein LOC129162930 [Nothobranchius furzeri]XP_054603806.1 uncharacterized protein LOC129165223 [Nothobranchius furzeri]XP_054605180.1 uncharacterized protein LOC129166567 [